MNAFRDLADDASVTEPPGSTPDFEAYLAHFTRDVGRWRRTVVTNQICWTTELDVELRQLLELLDGWAEIPARVEAQVAVTGGDDAIPRLAAGAAVVRPRFERGATRDGTGDTRALPRRRIRELHVAAIGRAARIGTVGIVDAGSGAAHLLHAQATAFGSGEAVAREACFRDWLRTSARALAGLTALGRRGRKTALSRPRLRTGHEVASQE